MPSLHEIEKTVATLWLNEEARNWLLNGRKGAVPECLRNAPPEILAAVDHKGVELYGHLLQFGHHDVLESIYPYCSKLLGKQWASVVNDYLHKCPPDHYNFNRLCSKLPHYFTVYGGKYVDKHPFLAELADYEWIELEKLEENADTVRQPHEQLATPEQIISFAPVVNPTLTIRQYKYNICQIAERLENNKRLGKVQPEETFVAIYRHPETNRCKFVELGKAAARVVDVARTPTSYQTLIPLAVSLTPEMTLEDCVMQYLELVEELQELGVFVGSQRVVS